MNLQVIAYRGILVTESREVAEMVDKNHAHLLRDIKGYKEVLDANPNLDSGNFFIESTYTDGQNQNRNCFLLTRKGCDMVANKMTGEKGILFTAAYVTRFEEMENSLKPKTQAEMFLMIAQQQVEAERKTAEIQLKQNKLEVKFENFSEIVGMRPKEWKDTAIKIIKAIAYAKGGAKNYQEVWKESYLLLESRAKCNLSIRVDNKKKNLALKGAANTELNKVSKISIIESDKRLIEIYISIIKDMAIKYKVDISAMEIQ